MGHRHVEGPKGLRLGHHVHALGRPGEGETVQEPPEVQEPQGLLDVRGPVRDEARR